MKKSKESKIYIVECYDNHLEDYTTIGIALSKNKAIELCEGLPIMLDKQVREAPIDEVFYDFYETSCIECEVHMTQTENAKVVWKESSRALL